MQLMEIAARWAWETSLAASVLIALALAAGVALRKPVFTPIRHLLGLLVVARLLLPVALPSPFSVFNWVRPGETVVRLTPRVAGFDEGLVTSSPTAPQEALVTAIVPSTIEPKQNFPILPAIWLVGAIAILARVIRQHFKVRRWICAGNRITAGAAAEAMNSALALSGCRRRIELYSVEGLSTPALFGLIRPAILLPAELASSGEVARLRMVCLHEIAHLRRMDVMINWLMIFAQAVHWFNPLVWIAMRRLRAEQELLCDGDVMRLLRPEEHHSYGETLLALAAPRGYALSTLIPISSNFKQLKERIGMIKQFKPTTHRLLLFTLPPLAAILAIGTFTGAAEKKAPPAVKKKPVEATELTKIEKTEKAIMALEQQFAIQNDRLSVMESRVDELRKKLKIYDTGNGVVPTSLEPETVRRIEQDRIRAEQEYVQFNQLYSTLKDKSRTELRHMLPTAYRDQALDELLQNLSKSEQQLVVMQKQYSDDHPEVTRARALIGKLNNQIENRITGILAGLETLVDARKAIVKSLNAQLDEAKKMDAENVEKYRPYFKAKRDLEMHQRLRDTLYLRMLQEKVDQQLAQ